VVVVVVYSRVVPHRYTYRHESRKHTRGQFRFYWFSDRYVSKSYLKALRNTMPTSAWCQMSVIWFALLPMGSRVFGRTRFVLKSH